MSAESPPPAPESPTRAPRTLVAVLVPAGFLAARHQLLLKPAEWLLGTNLSGRPEAFQVAAVYASWLVPILLVTAALSGWNLRLAARWLGLAAPAGPALGMALLACLPMLLGYAALTARPPALNADTLVFSSLLPGLMEELLFRGFLFGLLFRRAGWGFLPAVGINALFFAMGHLYQSSDPLWALAVFGTTLLGAGWFSWLYAEWDENLWLPVGLHVLMNFAWTAFGVAENAAGGMAANALRFATIVIMVLMTIRRRKRIGHFRVRPGTLWTAGTPDQAPACSGR